MPSFPKALLSWGVLSTLVAAVGAGSWLLWRPPDSKCMVANQVVALSTREHRGVTYSVQLVVSGFQDKSRSIFLYDEPVVPDACGVISLAPMASASVDETSGYHSIDVVHVDSPTTIRVSLRAPTFPEPRTTVKWNISAFP